MAVEMALERCVQRLRKQLNDEMETEMQLAARERMRSHEDLRQVGVTYRAQSCLRKRVRRQAGVCGWRDGCGVARAAALETAVTTTTRARRYVRLC